MKRILLTAVLAALTMFTTLPAKAAENAIPEAAEAALKESKSVSLFSLEPSSDKLKNGFHGYQILGQVALEEKDRAAVEADLRSALAHWDKETARCFNPRHGLRVDSNGVSYDFVICFECKNVHVYQGNKRVGEFGITGKPDVLNKLLSDAQVPLPAGPAEKK